MELSAKTKAFIPHLVGFLGMYCRKDSLPLKPTIASSIDSSRLRVYAALKLPMRGSRRGAELVEGIVTWLSLGNVVSVVVEVKKFENESKSVSFQDLTGLGYISMPCAGYYSLATLGYSL